MSNPISKNIRNDPADTSTLKNLTVKNNTTTLSSTTNYNLETSEIVNNAINITNISSNDFKIIVESGLYEVETQQGKIKMSSNNADNDAILLQNKNPNAGIKLDSGSSGIAFISSGDVDISADDKNINIGSSTTNNITLESSTNISTNSESLTQVTSDDIILKSTLGEIILDTNISTPNFPTLKCNTDGNIIINGNTSDSNFQTEININNEHNPNTGRNGLLVKSNNASVTPEIRISYANAANTNRIINTMGVYSETSSVAEFRKYYGFQFDNKLVALEGILFEESDIGRKIVFKQDSRITTITNISTLIIPPDSSYATSNVSVLGTYTGINNKFYKIEIDGTKNTELGRTSDTFKWSNNAGDTYNETFIPLSSAISPNTYELDHGIFVSFNTSEGNALGDFMSFSARIIALVDTTIIVEGNTETEKIHNALKKSQAFISTSPFNGYFGTVTNNDIILKTADQERFRITADGSIGASKDKIDARLHLTSDINKVQQVNENLVSSGVNVKGNQINAVTATLNTGGYVIVYESVEANRITYDIFGDYFTANGEKVGNGLSFKINDEPNYDQSHPHIAASGNVESDNYIVVWVSQDPNNEDNYQIKAGIFKNGNEPINISSTLVSDVSSKITLTPRVIGLTNGTYVITYTCLSDDTDDDIVNELYNIKYVILDSRGNIIRSEKPVTAANISTGLNYTYPFVCALNANDKNTKYAGGFVISYMKEVFSQDNRYQIVYKVFTANGKQNTPEHQVTTTGEIGEVGFLNTDFNLSDSRISLVTVPRNLAITDGGFMIAYKTNFSSSVPFVTNPTRNIKGVSSSAIGTLGTSVIDAVTGIHTITVNRTNGTFLDGELIFLQSTINGQTDFFLEKIETVTTVISNGFRTSTIILSKDPKQVIVARYTTLDIDSNNPNNLIYRKQINTTTIVNDRLLAELNLNTSLPLDFVRANTIFYAFRGLPVIAHNNLDKGICTWQTGNDPDVYYQQFNLVTGDLIDIEELIAESTIGYRQTDPYIAQLKTTQGNLLGYSICFTSSSLDGSDNGIFQQLIGPFSYLFHMNNDKAEFVLDNSSRLGIGTKEPESDIHIKSTANLNTNFVDQVGITMQTSTDHINNKDDLHKISFKDGSGDELGRIKVKYSNGYQDMNPDADNLVSFFKLDESIGSLIAVDSGLYNLQVNQDEEVIATSKGASALLKGFNVNECWIPGLINNGLEFNGLTSHLLIPRNGANNLFINTIDELHNSSFTISYWLKVEPNIFSGTRMDILSFGDADLSSGLSNDADLSSGLSNDAGFFQLSLRDSENTGTLKPAFGGLFTVFDSNNTPSTSLIEKTIDLSTLDIPSVNDGNWHNIVFIHNKTVIDGNSFSSRIVVYMDNNEIGNSDVLFGGVRHLLGSVEDITRDRDVYIGSGVGGSKNYYRGMLDELRFYRSVIPDTGLTRIYKYGSELRCQIQIQTLGDNLTYGDLEPSLTIDDTGSIVGARFKNNISRQLTGIVKISLLTPNIVEGVNNTTKFISELRPGDNLFLDNTPSGEETGLDLSNNFYQVDTIISNTRLILNRNVDITSNTFFSHVTIRPSIFSAYDDNELIRMNMDFNGDVVIGSDGKSSTDLTKLEIRGNDSSRINKHNLTLTNTTTDNIFNQNARLNKIQFKALKNNIDDVMMGSIDVSHSNTNITDNKSVLNIRLNDGTRTTYNELINVFSVYGTGKFNFNNGILEQNMLNDIQFNGKLSNGGEPVKLAFYSNEPATGVFTESTHLNFYGVDSLNRNQNTNDNSALVKILASNDKLVFTNEDDTSLLNGRIDFLINKQNDSTISGLRSRLCITSSGYSGIHIPRPNTAFDVAPEFAEEKVANIPITAVNTNTKTVTFTRDNIESAPLFSTADEKYLRCGRLVVNDGSNLTAYVISSGVTKSIFEGNNGLVLDSSETDINSSLLIDKDYTLHYPGLKVNKYGLVCIGDSRFNDASEDYHLSVSGDTCIKGELNFASNIDVLSTDTISSVGIKTNDVGELLIKDSTTQGYVKAIGGPLITPINKVTVSTDLTYTATTVLVNNNVNEDIIIKIPTTGVEFSGSIFNIKKISNTGNVKIICNDSTTIDGVVEQKLETQFSSITIQTDGTEWFIIGSHL